MNAQPNKSDHWESDTTGLAWLSEYDQAFLNYAEGQVKTEEGLMVRKHMLRQVIGILDGLSGGYNLQTMGDIAVMATLREQNEREKEARARKERIRLAAAERRHKNWDNPSELDAAA